MAKEQEQEQDSSEGLDVLHDASDLYEEDAVEKDPPSAGSEDSDKEQPLQAQDEGQGQEQKQDKSEQNTIPRSYATKLEQSNADLRNQLNYTNGRLEQLQAFNENQAEPPEDQFFDNLAEGMAEDPEKAMKSLKVHLDNREQKLIQTILASSEFGKVQEIIQDNQLQVAVSDILLKYDDATELMPAITKRVMSRVGDISSLSPEQAQVKLNWAMNGGIDDTYWIIKNQSIDKANLTEEQIAARQANNRHANLGSGTAVTGQGQAGRGKKVKTRIGEVDADDLDFISDKSMIL